MFAEHRALKRRVEVLRGFSFFADCTFAELAGIDRLGALVDARPGQTLTREGERGYGCVLTLDGIAIAARAGRPVGSIGAASIAGEMALLDHARRNATVVATTPMRLIVFSDREFREVLTIAPGVEERLARIADERRVPA